MIGEAGALVIKPTLLFLVGVTGIDFLELIFGED